MKSKYKTKFFPFSAGIPWKILNGKYVVPEMEKDIWDSVLDNKDPVILAHGGLIESYFSFALVNAIGRVEVDKDIYWSGNDKYSFLIQYQGLAKYKSDVSKNLGNKYPVPLFFDKKNFAYFNCLNNYLIKRSYYLKNDRQNNEPLFKQMFDNSMLPWDPKHIPNLKYFDYSTYDAWASENNFFDNKRYILVFIESEITHSIKSLDWKYDSILSLAAMVKQFDVDVVVCTSKKGRYYNNQNIFTVEENFKLIYPLIQNSWMILSNNIDYLLLSLCVSDAMVCFDSLCNIKRTAFDMYRNADYLGSENMIYSSEAISPVDIYMQVSELS